MNLICRNQRGKRNILHSTGKIEKLKKVFEFLLHIFFLLLLQEC